MESEFDKILEKAKARKHRATLEYSRHDYYFPKHVRAHTQDSEYCSPEVVLIRAWPGHLMDLLVQVGAVTDVRKGPKCCWLNL